MDIEYDIIIWKQKDNRGGIGFDDQKKIEAKVGVNGNNHERNVYTINLNNLILIIVAVKRSPNATSNHMNIGLLITFI